MSLYFFEKENSISYHSIFFFIVSLINLQSIRVYEEKNKILKFILFSIVPLLIYIALFLTYGNKYFLQYKNLISIPVIFSLYQIFKFVKFGKSKKQGVPNWQRGITPYKIIAWYEPTYENPRGFSIRFLFSKFSD